jgi:hypothetical protein
LDVDIRSEFSPVSSSRETDPEMRLAIRSRAARGDAPNSR